MALPKLQLGAEPRKLAVLACLLGLAAYLFYVNVFSDSAAPTAPPRAAAPAKSLPTAVSSMTDSVAEPQRRTQAPAAAGRGARSDFKPSLKQRTGKDGTRLTTSDPTLRLDLLEKLASVKVARGERSLFDFATGPPKPAEKPKLPEPKIEVAAKRMIGPEPPPPKPAPPVKPPPPPINLKFYGNSLPVRGGVKRVFCMDGDQVFVPAEGEIFKKRYKIVRINANSVVVEDLDYKNEQTLPIEEAPKTG